MADNMLKYYIEESDIYDYSDEMPFRSYDLVAEGNTLEECFDNATVCAVDQDGGELYTCSIYDEGEALSRAAEYVITRAIELERQEPWQNLRNS